MPKLSVITTVFNGEKYLQESLESVFNQTFQDFELLLVDDGSTDNTFNVMLEYNKYAKVKILQNKHNEGIAVSRNRSLLEAKGDYIAIHDADDISLPTRFIKQISILDNNKQIGFLGSHAIKISFNGHIIGYMNYPPEETKTAFKQIVNLKLNPIIDPSCMFRRKLVLDHGGYKMDMRHSMDFDLWCRLLLDNIQMTNISEPLIKYRIHNENISKVQKKEMRQVALDICAKFQRQNLEQPVLRKDYYMQDCFIKLLKKNKGDINV